MIDWIAYSCAGQLIQSIMKLGAARLDWRLTAIDSSKHQIAYKAPKEAGACRAAADNDDGNYEEKGEAGDDECENNCNNDA